MLIPDVTIVSRTSKKLLQAVVGRVRTDPGKVMEFKVEIFQALKSLENDQRYVKVWKNPWKL